MPNPNWRDHEEKPYKNVEIRTGGIFTSTDNTESRGRDALSSGCRRQAAIILICLAGLLILSLASLAQAQEVTCSDLYEPDNLITSTLTLHSYSFAQTHTLHAQNDIDFFALDLTTNTQVLLETSNLVRTDTIIHLYNQDHKLIGVNDDRTSGTPESRLLFRAIYDGPYYFSVKDFYSRGSCEPLYTYDIGVAIYKTSYIYLPIVTR